MGRKQGEHEKEEHGEGEPDPCNKQIESMGYDWVGLSSAEVHAGIGQEEEECDAEMVVDSELRFIILGERKVRAEIMVDGKGMGGMFDLGWVWWSGGGGMFLKVPIEGKERGWKHGEFG